MLFTLLFNHSLLISSPPDHAHINQLTDNFKAMNYSFNTVQHIQSIYQHCERHFGTTDPLMEDTILRLEGKSFKQLSFLFNYYNSDISFISYGLICLPLVSLVFVTHKSNQISFIQFYLISPDSDWCPGDICTINFSLFLKHLN